MLTAASNGTRAGVISLRPDQFPPILLAQRAHPAEAPPAVWERMTRNPEVEPRLQPQRLVLPNAVVATKLCDRQDLFPFSLRQAWPPLAISGGRGICNNYVIAAGSVLQSRSSIGAY